MPSTRPLLCLALVGCALTPAARAANGGIDSFWASATQVQVGDTVDFSVALSLTTSGYSYGGSNPYEPPPAEGYQEWNVNWYYWEYETLNSVWLQAGSAGFYEAPGVGAGGSYGTTWTFSVTFDTPGTYSFDAYGGWQSDIQSGFSSESATRNCYYVDPDNPGDLWCDSWYWQYSDYTDWYSTDGSLWGGSISIEVLTPVVPEPATWASMLAGVALLGAGARRRRARVAARPR